MKNVRKLIMITLSSILLGLFFFGCNKIDVPKGTPKCIKDKIKKQKDSCLENVYEYNYNNQTVYFFSTKNCPDASSVLYDKNCNEVCFFGGISGNGGSSCTDFYSVRTSEKLIWKR